VRGRVADNKLEALLLLLGQLGAGLLLTADLVPGQPLGVGAVGRRRR
jgi:hypothetical protein